MDALVVPETNNKNALAFLWNAKVCGVNERWNDVIGEVVSQM